MRNYRFAIPWEGISECFVHIQNFRLLQMAKMRQLIRLNVSDILSKYTRREINNKFGIYQPITPYYISLGNLNVSVTPWIYLHHLILLFLIDIIFCTYNKYMNAFKSNPNFHIWCRKSFRPSLSKPSKTAIMCTTSHAHCLMHYENIYISELCIDRLQFICQNTKKCVSMECGIFGLW